jgi:ribonuclease HII
MPALLPFYTANVLEAGCDEAGRGCLAGPVFAAAVILPLGYAPLGLTDSKQLTEKKRYALRHEICQNALAWAVASFSPRQIDEVNILNASIFSMHKALDELALRPQHIIIDGNRFKPYQKIPHITIVKGDAKYLSIAAASVLAKTFRDDYMVELHTQFPHYNWQQNKGYPTADHRRAIAQHGLTVHHRKSFKQLDTQYKIDWPL